MAMVILLSIIATLCSCNSLHYRKGKVKMDIQKEPFGKTDGKNVDLYTLTNANGLRMTAMTYGAIVVSLEVPDKTGKLGGRHSRLTRLVTGFKQSRPYGYTGQIIDMKIGGVDIAGYFPANKRLKRVDQHAAVVVQFIGITQRHIPQLAEGRLQVHHAGCALEILLRDVYLGKKVILAAKVVLQII